MLNVLLLHYFLGVRGRTLPQLQPQVLLKKLDQNDMTRSIHYKSEHVTLSQVPDIAHQLDPNLLFINDVDDNAMIFTNDGLGNSNDVIVDTALCGSVLNSNIHF